MIATLLIPGHPAIERAAAAVLAQGDAGHAFLPWPTSRTPARSTLEAYARERVPVEHRAEALPDDRSLVPYWHDDRDERLVGVQPQAFRSLDLCALRLGVHRRTPATTRS